mmetsp:Transcript_9365/g.25441  ORF Transcript_9365/g.25441 Transcript_9365/m.25441 type:complete len:370 (+) Transcript_9365:228-1337(+)
MACAHTAALYQLDILDSLVTSLAIFRLIISIISTVIATSMIVVLRISSSILLLLLDAAHRRFIVIVGFVDIIFLLLKALATHDGMVDGAFSILQAPQPPNALQQQHWKDAEMKDADAVAIIPERLADADDSEDDAHEGSPYVSEEGDGSQARRWKAGDEGGRDEGCCVRREGGVDEVDRHDVDVDVHGLGAEVLQQRVEGVHGRDAVREGLIEGGAREDDVEEEPEDGLDGMADGTRGGDLDLVAQRGGGVHRVSTGWEEDDGRQRGTDTLGHEDVRHLVDGHGDEQDGTMQEDDVGQVQLLILVLDRRIDDLREEVDEEKRMDVVRLPFHRPGSDWYQALQHGGFARTRMYNTCTNCSARTMYGSPAQ